MKMPTIHYCASRKLNPLWQKCSCQLTNETDIINAPKIINKTETETWKFSDDMMITLLCKEKESLKSLKTERRNWRNFEENFSKTILVVMITIEIELILV